MTRQTVLGAVACSLFVSPVFAQGTAPGTAPAPPAVTAPLHTMVMPADLKWMDGPPGLPPGGKMAVLFGDPGKPGMFILRAKLPAEYKIPAHWHATDETVTVLSGTIMMGMAAKLDAKAATSMTVGAFAGMPANTSHFLMTKGEAEIQVAGVGPFSITYVNPDDDPRKTASKPAAAAEPAKK